MSGATSDAPRRLAELEFNHPMISAFLDLDPGRFATGSARTTEINSLLDQAQQRLHAQPLDHRDRVSLGQDLQRVGSYLTTELDASGTHGVAVYCSGREALFEAIRLPHQVASDLVIEPIPVLEPLLPAPVPARVCVTLINRRDARFFIPADESGLAEQAFAQQDEHDRVRGQHRQGGRSEANYERSIEADVDAHLRRAAEQLFRLVRLHRCDRLVLGGPHEVVIRFINQLHPELRAIVDERELALDVGTSSVVEVMDALSPLQKRWHEMAQWQALQQLLSGLEGRQGIATGISETLAALGRRQVASLVLGPHMDAEGSVCPRCEQLYTAEHAGGCEADGSELQQLHGLRSAMIRSAIRQDADVVVLQDFADRPEIAAVAGVGAILRY